MCIPTVIIVGGLSGWSRSAIGLPTWASWTLAVPATVVGLVFAWSSTALATTSTTKSLLKAYRRLGIEGAEQEYMRFGISRERAGGAWFNVALALDREGDDEAAEAVYRHAAECGIAPAMINLANRLRRRGEEIEAQALYRRAIEAGFVLGDHA
jgi:tetratricopeptide (TPR) repeat protein